MPSYNIRVEKPPSKSVLLARARRLARAVQITTRTEWFVREVSDKVNVTFKNRVRMATELVRSKVVLNISRPVTKSYTTRISTDPTSGRTLRTSYVSISDRSKPGEFPKADTTLLMKSIFGNVVTEQPGTFIGYVGMPLDYGVVLELELNRSFLVRTLNEERSTVMRILTGPIK